MNGWRGSTLAIVAVGLTGCVTARPAKVPGYGKSFHISCGMTNHSECVDKASEVCPSGFEVISDTVTSHVVVSDGSGGSIPQGEMTVGCTGSNEAGDPSDPDAPASVPESAPASTPAPAPAQPSTPAPALVPGPAKTDPPTSAAGFEFGASEADAEAKCTEAGENWGPGSPRHFKCSGTPVTIGIDATVVVKICDSGVCAVQLVATPKDRSTWPKHFEKLERAVTAKYGNPAKRQVNLPNYCSGPRVKDCIDDGTVRGTILWAWQSGEKVQLFMGKQGSEPVIRLIYQTPERPAAGL